MIAMFCNNEIVKIKWTSHSSSYLTGEIMLQINYFIKTLCCVVRGFILSRYVLKRK